MSDQRKKDVTIIVHGVPADLPDDRVAYMVMTGMAGRAGSVTVGKAKEVRKLPLAAEKIEKRVEAHRKGEKA